MTHKDVAPRSKIPAHTGNYLFLVFSGEINNYVSEKDYIHYFIQGVMLFQ